MLDTATMPVAAQTRVGRPGDPCVMVIFGAAGDLTRRKLVPALYNLARNQLLSREFAVLGIAHSSMSEEEFRKKVIEDVRQYTGNDGDPDLIEWFIRHMYYVTGEFDDKNIYPQLKNHLEKIDKEHSTHGDRKSTRLNSSHTVISYAVFCLKKKNKNNIKKNTTK